MGRYEFGWIVRFDNLTLVLAVILIGEFVPHFNFLCGSLMEISGCGHSKNLTSELGVLSFPSFQGDACSMAHEHGVQEKSK